MKIEINLTHDEKCDLLEKHGLRVGVEEVTMSWNVYHNDVEFEEVEVYSVRNATTLEQVYRPSLRSFGKHDWLDAAVEAVLEQRLKKLLLKE